MALAMAYSGAAGDTKEAMAKTLKVQGLELERLNQNNLALGYLLTAADPKITLDIANSIWVRENFAFNRDFLETIKNDYQARAEALDFGDPKSADVINKWVSDQTKGQIDGIVTPPIDPNGIMFLINAVYFKGDWSSPFNRDQTTDQHFQTGDGQTVTVPMMHQSGTFDYMKTDGFEAVRLPYGEKEQVAMYLFLPQGDSGLEALTQQLNQDNWKAWQSLFEKKSGSVMLPRFTMKDERSLNKVLTDLGMGVAFDPGKADFSGMATADLDQKMFISEVKHKTFLQVDETGTEAAAATSVGISLTSMPVDDFELKFDRPFFYLIADRQTGAILFMGSVMDPTK
jgi:serpin B